MRIGLLGVVSGDDALRVVEGAGHEPVVLDLEVHDLHRVQAVWVPADPGPGWRTGAPLMADLAIAVDRGIPLLATGPGVPALVDTALLPGRLTAGTGVNRRLRVVSRDSAWTHGLALDHEVTVEVDPDRAVWSVDEYAGARVVARWLDDPTYDIAGLASAAGNVVGLLGRLEQAGDDPAALAWLTTPTAMLRAEPLLTAGTP